MSAQSSARFRPAGCALQPAVCGMMSPRIARDRSSANSLAASWGTARAQGGCMLRLKPRELPDGFSIADFTPTSALVPPRLSGNLLVSALRWLMGDQGLPQVAAV